MSLLQFHMLRLELLKCDLPASSRVLASRNLSESLDDPSNVWGVLSGMCCIYPIDSASTKTPGGEL